MRPPARLLPYIVPKGFIAVDGTSLTVCEVDAAGGWFDFMLVAYTQQKIVIPKKSVGETVNLEVDVLAKYVERLLHRPEPGKSLSLDDLIRAGFTK